jgi:acetyl-CoA synthetase
LFSSGTTGDPKAIPWTHLTPIKCAMDGRYHQDIGPGSVVCWPTNIGWMMGPWLIYATLMNRGCIALYEGLPSGTGFADFVSRAGVTMLGVVPSLVRAWRDSDACSAANWSRIETFSSTGEPSNRRDYLWLTSLTGHRAPVIEYCGGTEIGGGYATGTVVQPASPSTFTTPALGLDFVILDDENQPVPEGREGEVFLVPPSVGLSQTLLNRDHEKVYHDGCPAGPAGEVLRRHGDQLARLPGGFFRAQGRADDTMNLGGIKISSLELERVMDHHPAISESAAVAVQAGGEGAERLVVFAIADWDADAEQLLTDLRRMISNELNPLFKIHDLVIVESLPRTASNKLMRRELRDHYQARP